MKIAFWCSAAVVFYSYLGYAGWLWVESHLRPWPLRRGLYLPSVSVIMVARDEEKHLSRKLENFAALDYPQDRIEFVIVSDGSRDGTENLLLAAAKDARYRVLIFPESRGKAARLNDAVAAAKGEVLLFVDARQEVERHALRFLMEDFAEGMVGCASGELMLGDPTSGEAEQGMGVYWRVEKKIRELESASGSVVGATGAIYAARRDLVAQVPAGTILDDVFIPMQIARQGRRVVFDERARAWDNPDLGGQREFQRKVRTLTGNYQLLQIAPWLLRSENPLRFRFLSHKLLRLIVPFALAAMLLTSAAIPHPFYRLLLVGQLFFYGLSLLALTRAQLGPLARVANAALTLIVLNTAAVVAFANFLTGRKEVWAR